MLEFFRRHRGAFLITVTVIIIISFSVWGGWKGGRERGMAQPSDPAFSMYGRTYSIAEAQRYGRRMEAIYGLQMFELLGLSRAGGNDEQGNNMIFNQVVLEHEMERLGIHPSDEEARQILKNLPSFQENGTFSATRAQNIQMMFNANGFTNEDILKLVKLSIGYSKLRDLIGKNYVASPFIAEKAYANINQTLKVNTITFNLEDYKKTAEVKDEEIQKYYDEKKEGYKTSEQRAISYVFFESPKADDKKSLEDRAKEDKAVVERVNKFNDASTSPAAKFEEVAKTLKETVSKTELFSQDTAPEAIKSEPELIEAIFALNAEARPISDPIKGSNGYYIFSITKTQAPKQQELAEVKDKVKEALVEQKAQEALTKAVNDTRETLTKGLKEGKKIADLSKELKLTLSPVQEVTVSAPAPEIPQSRLIASNAQETPVGELTNGVDTGSGSILIYVSAKELRKDEASAAKRTSTSNNISEQERNRLFDTWFAERRELAKPKMLIRQA